ncbi:MAG TPA: dihydrofolate reductase family protein [Candidatus Saccharimonadia bacterium]|nr:dihydrofolate reductase family protein [Candidatus Saccharimonadia bacterium]
MKVFILAAQTADGYVGRNATHLAHTWTTYEDKRLFTWITKWAHVMVVGGNTYRTFDRDLPGRRLIVYTRSQHAPKDNVEFTSEPPEQLLSRLEKEGVKGVAICGGTQIYDLFMQSGLVQELYITIQPKLFGAGISLFQTSLDLDLKLDEAQVSTKDDTVILHYLVSPKP